MKFDAKYIDKYDIKSFTPRVTNNGFAHPERHKNRTNEDILNQIIDPYWPKKIDGTYDGDTDVNSVIEQVFKYSKKNIEKWFNDHNPTTYTEKHAFCAPVTGCTAHGFKSVNGFIRGFEHKTTAVIVLIRDDTAPSGMRLQSTYAGLPQEHQIDKNIPNHLDVMTRDDLTNVLKKTPAYKNEKNPMKKTWLEVRCMANAFGGKSSIDVNFNTYKNGFKIQSPCKSPFVKDGIEHPTQWVMEVDENHCKIYRECTDTKMKIGAKWMREIKENYTKPSKLIDNNKTIDLVDIQLSNDDALELLNEHWFAQKALQVNAIRKRNLRADQPDLVLSPTPIKQIQDQDGFEM